MAGRFLKVDIHHEGLFNELVGTRQEFSRRVCYKTSTIEDQIILAPHDVEVDNRRIDLFCTTLDQRKANFILFSLEG